MATHIYEASDNRMLVSVTFRRESPEGGEPKIEAIYHLHWPSSFTIQGDPFVLVPLSYTRTDTRQPVVLSMEEEKVILDEAVTAASRHHLYLSDPDDED